MYRKCSRNLAFSTLPSLEFTAREHTSCIRATGPLSGIFSFKGCGNRCRIRFPIVGLFGAKEVAYAPASSADVLDSARDLDDTDAEAVDLAGVFGSEGGVLVIHGSVLSLSVRWPSPVDGHAFSILATSTTTLMCSER
jgi:hypothetical protein